MKLDENISHSPIIVARKPLSENTVVDNVIEWGTGGINIDECRIGVSDNDPNHRNTKPSKSGDSSMFGIGGVNYGQNIKGRFPANIIFDEEAGKVLDEQSGITTSGVVKTDKGSYDGESNTNFLRGVSNKNNQHGDSGGASRFFYSPKLEDDELKMNNNNKTDMKLILGDCLDKLKELEDNSVDSVVTDPPYGLSFMGKKWDYDVPSKEIWEECMRVLKPGGHLLAFAGSRTYHRMAVRIEDAGFEIRDMISWIYGSGFPKSMDISKQIDKRAGAEREVIGTTKGKGGENLNKLSREGKGDADTAKSMGAYGLGAKQITVDIPLTSPATDEAKKWEGWGTALKPAHEPVVMARKPLSENTVADNVLEWGTGGINIDGSRIPTDEDTRRNAKGGENGLGDTSTFKIRERFASDMPKHDGRFPANVIFDEEAGKMLDEQTGELKSGFMKAGTARKMSESDVNAYGHYDSDTTYNDTYGDSGGASRFFYCPKTSKKERNEGCDEFEERKRDESRKDGNVGGDNPRNRGVNKVKNHHPTVKPTDLMLYLIRLVTPKGGVTLDPFMGSGSTGKAAVRGGFDFIGIEREEEYFQIAEGRINYEINKPTKTTKSKVEVSKEVEEKVNQFFG